MFTKDPISQMTKIFEILGANYISYNTVQLQQRTHKHMHNSAKNDVLISFLLIMKMYI